MSNNNNNNNNNNNTDANTITPEQLAALLNTAGANKGTAVVTLKYNRDGVTVASITTAAAAALVGTPFNNPINGDKSPRSRTLSTAKSAIIAATLDVFTAAMAGYGVQVVDARATDTDTDTE